ncbi:hypothetical protein TVAG_180490 [Trichomonas vaginalis G3]|uniref:Uncharacterized protein n=1 Tax=Trichomonas vaginalis (strain ATCC PRA-98 / G3) TaxID=412133 RepID=A2EE78_TRIV3|nr:hypothetical protein TVAGG3_0614110 [Trichomonas vaginalis G3]EAY09075.1 hypothetical protein TVAG_180490 [Trichomonas vaginalis G3]KAI5503409.1 hypothetical protein TVAGG3_0614110 [Trichomonas vaginalis G3]|eukprot:XP_001321298.1 hypothetical protein [Trichomonas vaginalis G3]
MHFKVDIDDPEQGIDSLKLSTALEDERKACQVKIINAINKAYEKFDEIILFHGYLNLPKYINFLVQVSESEFGQEYLRNNINVEQIKSLVDIYNEKQTYDVMYSIVHLFVNISYLSEDATKYFIENGVHNTLISMNIPKEIEYYKDYFRLIYNLTSVEPEIYEEQQVIILLKQLVRADAIRKQFGLKSLTNIFRQKIFSNSTVNISVLDLLHKILLSNDGTVRETVAWFVHFQLEGNEARFFLSDICRSQIMNEFVDSLFKCDNSVLVNIILSIFSRIVIFNIGEYVEKLFNSDVLEAALNLVTHENVGEYALCLVNNFMAADNNYLEYCLSQNFHANSLDVFDNGNVRVKQECIRAWLIINDLGNSLQANTVLNEFVIEKIIDFLSSDSEEDFLVYGLSLLIKLCDKEPKFAEMFDLSDFDNIQDQESEKIQELYQVIVDRMSPEE